MRTVALAIAMLSCGVVEAAAQDPPKGPAGTVSLPLAEYDRLVDRARDGGKRPQPPPVAAVLARADLRVRVADGTARGAFVLEGEVFRSGPTRVALVAAATLLDARLAGKPLPVFREGDVTSAVIVGPAPFTVAVDWAASVVAEPGRASLSVPVPAAGSARISLDLPGEQMDVRIEPGLVTHRAAAAGRTVVEATLEPGREARVSWSAREGSTSAAAREVRLLSDVKTLVSLDESDLRLTALVEVNVVQGEPRRFVLHLPPGFEVSGVSGSALDTTEETAGSLTLKLIENAPRRAVFLVGLEQAAASRSFERELPFVSVEGAQRETGEIAFEGMGTLELVASEGGTLRRMDAREVAQPLRALARQPLLAAFRYHRRADEAPSLKLAVRRFPDAPVLAALAERAQVTTLVTSEGRMLTEIALTVRNQAQPFLRIGLPAGATILSADVGGESVKPVQGEGGARVPLLRPGFRPEGPYAVSFAYLHAGTALGRKGTAEIALPKLDLPVSVVEWELFLPDRYKVKSFGGNVLRAELLPEYGGDVGVAGGLVGGVEGGVAGGVVGGLEDMPAGITEAPGQISGRISDSSGSVLPGTTVVVTGPGYRRETITRADGRYVVTDVPSGPVQVEARLVGFNQARRSLRFEASTSRRVDIALKVGTLAETVTVEAEAPLIDAKRTGTGATFSDESRNEYQRPAPGSPPAAPSSNVLNLQRRVAGVLPVRVTVPREGTSHRFLRPLVVDEETTVSFRYDAKR